MDEIPDRDSREDSVQAASDVERLYKCIDRLSLADRTLVSLYLEELTTKEMADILGISEANVRVKLHRTKKTLREMWEEKTDGPE